MAEGRWPAREKTTNRCRLLLRRDLSFASLPLQPHSIEKEPLPALGNLNSVGHFHSLPAEGIGPCLFNREKATFAAIHYVIVERSRD